MAATGDAETQQGDEGAVVRAAAAGPGLDPTKPDPSGWIAVALGVLGLLPNAVYASVGLIRFGPFLFAALWSIAAVLAGVIGVLRAVERKDARLRLLAIAGAAMGLTRLLLFPLLD